MKTHGRTWKVFASAVLLGSMITPLAHAQAAPTRQRPRIAILDFDYSAVRTSTSALFGTDVDVGNGISALLVNDLVKDGSYSIIERKAIEKVMTEQNFSNSDRADPNTASKLGKLLGVDAILVGNITQFGNETKNMNLGGMMGNWHGVGAGGIGHSKSKANVGVTARLVNVNTGEILAVAEGKGESSRSSNSLLGGGSNWRGFGGGHADFGSSDFQETIIGEATKAAVDKLTADLVSSVSKVTIEQHTVTVEGIVAAVDGGQIVLNVGGKAGIKVGDQLNVMRITREIKDPVTGAVIRRLTSTVGVIKATDVDEGSAVCTAVSGSGFQTGDRVKTVTNQ